jgi:predicted alpha/beta hydrolase family esterase
MAFSGNPVRVLIVPGLHDSGPAHWQTWLEAHHRHAVRVRQDDWGRPDLLRWSRRIRETVQRHERASWVAVGHSFGCLALAHALSQGQYGVQAALLVAPADPRKFEVEAQLPRAPLPVPSVMLGSETDPWMHIADARAWAESWQSRFINLGDVGHINVDSGFGPLPQAKTLVRQLIQRVERKRRVLRAHASEFSFAV